MQRNASSKNPALHWPALKLKGIRKESNEKKIKRERERESEENNYISSISNLRLYPCYLGNNCIKAIFGRYHNTLTQLHMKIPRDNMCSCMLQ